MTEMSRVLDEHTRQTMGPFAIVRTCLLCGFFHSRNRGTGRGAGMKFGNIQRGILYQHLKNEHPEVFKENIND